MWTYNNKLLSCFRVSLLCIQSGIYCSNHSTKYFGTSFYDYLLTPLTRTWRRLDHPLYPHDILDILGISLPMLFLSFCCETTITFQRSCLKSFFKHLFFIFLSCIVQLHKLWDFPNTHPPNFHFPTDFPVLLQ